MLLWNDHIKQIIFETMHTTLFMRILLEKGYTEDQGNHLQNNITMEHAEIGHDDVSLTEDTN
jgi:hypothetical protein